MDEHNLVSHVEGLLKSAKRKQTLAEQEDPNDLECYQYYEGQIHSLESVLEALSKQTPQGEYK